MAININIPSQVKNYANLAAFPASGSLKTIYIAEDTNKTYRWTGSVYVEISATAASTWGSITGTLSSQTDLQTALNGKVPTSRTLTINGTTQDLSADRTFTISTGITIGTTAITSGTNGRFLFDDGGVVSETNGAFWDKVNSRWGIGTITPASKVDIRRTNATIQLDEFTTNSATGCLWFASTKSTSNFSIAGEGTNTLINAPSGYVGFFQGLAEKARFASATGNLLINTTTDAGFKLDVNGTARVKDAGSELAITSPLSSIAPVIFTTKGASGGYRGGYNFKGGFGGTAGNTILIMDTTNTDAGSRVGIGNLVFGDLSSAKLSIDNTQSGGRNAGVKLRANFANTSTEYNGIQFDTIEIGNGGAFIGSQRNTAASGYGSDLVVLNTAESPSNTYVETARFIGRYNSFYVGTDKTLAVASAKMQIESTTKGFLPPRMTTTQKNAIATPATGLQIYDNTLNRPCFYDGTTWITL
jgi:hypothetical protein